MKEKQTNKQTHEITNPNQNNNNCHLLSVGNLNWWILNGLEVLLKIPECTIQAQRESHLDHASCSLFSKFSAMTFEHRTIYILFRAIDFSHSSAQSQCPEYIT